MFTVDEVNEADPLCLSSYWVKRHSLCANCTNSRSGDGNSWRVDWRASIIHRHSSDPTNRLSSLPPTWPAALALQQICVSWWGKKRCIYKFNSNLHTYAAAVNCADRMNAGQMLEHWFFFTPFLYFLIETFPQSKLACTLQNKHFVLPLKIDVEVNIHFYKIKPFAASC